MTGESLYALSGVVVLVIAFAALWHIRGTFQSERIFSAPGDLSRGQLKNVASFARMTMKNSEPGSEKHEDARRRHEAAVRELARRAGS